VLLITGVIGVEGVITLGFPPPEVPVSVPGGGPPPDEFPEPEPVSPPPDPPLAEPLLESVPLPVELPLSDPFVEVLDPATAPELLSFPPPPPQEEQQAVRINRPVIRNSLPVIWAPLSLTYLLCTFRELSIGQNDLPFGDRSSTPFLEIRHQPVRGKDPRGDKRDLHSRSLQRFPAKLESAQKEASSADCLDGKGGVETPSTDSL